MGGRVQYMVVRSRRRRGVESKGLMKLALVSRRMIVNLYVPLQTVCVGISEHMNKHDLIQNLLQTEPEASLFVQLMSEPSTCGWNTDSRVPVSMSCRSQAL